MENRQLLKAQISFSIHNWYGKILLYKVGSVHSVQFIHSFQGPAIGFPYIRWSPFTLAFTSYFGEGEEIGSSSDRIHNTLVTITYSDNGRVFSTQELL